MTEGYAACIPELMEFFGDCMLITEVGCKRPWRGFGRRIDFLAVDDCKCEVKLYGGEIKLGRSDWKNELKNPAKSKTWRRCCHRWYLVTWPGVAKLEEIPEGWGWINCVDDRAELIKESVDIVRPRLPSWQMWSNIIRMVRKSPRPVAACLSEEEKRRHFEACKGKLVTLE